MSRTESSKSDVSFLNSSEKAVAEEEEELLEGVFVETCRAYTKSNAYPYDTSRHLVWWNDPFMKKSANCHHANGIEE